jgi:flagellar hook-associated protein 1 FlgK
VTIASALSIATGGLRNVNAQLALVSQNVANASTPGYAREIGTQYNVVAEGQGLGVHTGPAIRDVDTALQAAVFSQNGTVAGFQTRQAALQAIDSVMGTPGQNADIASLIADLQNQFSTLLNDPSSLAQQSQVVTSASTLAQNINTLSSAYGAQRQTAQDNIVAEIGTLNTTLATIGKLSNQIITLKPSGQSTADLESQRDAAIATVSQLVSVKVLQQPNGDVLLTTAAGLTLPTHSDTPPLSTSDVNVQSATYYPGGGIPAIMLGGMDVTRQLQGGQIGANITLRDTTLPTDQGELDELSQSMATRFRANGLTLFTDPTGNVPVPTPPPTQSGYVGFAGTIQVNPAVLANPSMVRDGDAPPVPTQAGYTTIIKAVLNNTLGSNPPLAANVTGLGPSGTLSAPFSSPPTLGGFASSMLAAQAQDSGTATDQLATEQSVQTMLNSKLAAQSGVSIDTEMSNMIQLQNAYGANARVIAAVQSMWNQLLGSVS